MKKLSILALIASLFASTQSIAIVSKTKGNVKYKKKVGADGSVDLKPGLDLFNNDFQNDISFDNFEDDQDFENPEDEFPMDDFQPEESNVKLKIYQFNPENSEINKEFESLKENISDFFESNYFLINIKSDYLSSLNFLRYLQEYKIAILPYCFEPQMTGNNFNDLENVNSASVGEIDARIIVNIPNYK